MVYGKNKKGHPKKANGVFGICEYKLKGKELECNDYWLGKDGLCDNPFRQCCKLDIEDCIKKGYIIEHESDFAGVRSYEYTTKKL